MLETEADEVLELGGIPVRVTHAEHESRRWPLVKPSASLGYVVDGSTSVYFAGDTDLFAGMAEFAPVEVAVLPVSGWGSRLPAGHLTPARAAEALRLLRPRIAVPVHWGTFRTPLAPKLGDRPAREFVSAAARVAPDVEVRVLQLGETLPFEAMPPERRGRTAGGRRTETLAEARRGRRAGRGGDRRDVRLRAAPVRQLRRGLGPGEDALLGVGPGLARSGRAQPGHLRAALDGGVARPALPAGRDRDAGLDRAGRTSPRAAPRWESGSRPRCCSAGASTPTRWHWR